MWAYKASVSSPQEAGSHAEVIGKKPPLLPLAPLSPQGLESGWGGVTSYNTLLLDPNLIFLKSNVIVMLLVCFVFKIVQTLLSTIVRSPVLGPLISLLIELLHLKNLVPYSEITWLFLFINPWTILHMCLLFLKA